MGCVASNQHRPAPWPRAANASVAAYGRLLKWVDAQAVRLCALHGEDITCRPGCDGCCVNLTVFPVEFFAIRHALQQNGRSPAVIGFDATAACGFLSDGRCRIYAYRPIICRTHGLPILFLDDAAEPPAWQVTFCERNFTGHVQVEFSDTALLDVERLNMTLARINRAFGRAWPGGAGLGGRIPMACLCRSDAALGEGGSQPT